MGVACPVLLPHKNCGFKAGAFSVGAPQTILAAKMTTTRSANVRIHMPCTYTGMKERGMLHPAVRVPCERLFENKK